MNNKTLRRLLYSTALLATITGVSVNTYASEINEPTNEPATQEYIAPEVTAEPAPVVDQEPVHNIEETQQTLESAETTIVEPEIPEPTLNEIVEENQEPVVEPIPEFIEEDNVVETNPAPVENIEPTPAPEVIENVEQESEEKELVQNSEKVISQPKVNISEIGGAGNYQIKATGTGKIIIFIGKKTVIQDGIEGEISGIYSINVVDGKIDAQDQYLLSLAEDSYLYATGTVTFDISPYIESTETPEIPTEEEKETPAPEQEKTAVEDEKEKPTIEPKDEEKVTGKYIGQYESNSKLNRTAEVYYDSKTNILNFKGMGYYFDNPNEKIESIKIAVNQNKVTINGDMFELKWENGELIGFKAIEQGFTSQDDEINDQLSKYPVFGGADEKDYDAKPLQKYEYLDIDDKNIRDENGFYDAEKLGFYYTDTSFGLDIKNLALGASTETAMRIKGIKLPAEFLNTEIFKREVGKTHYAYSFFKGSQRGGYDLVVIYFRLEEDGTLTVVRDFHSILTKGARYADIFAKVEMEPTIEPEQPATPVKPEEPTPAPKEEQPKKIIEEENVETTEAKGKGVTPKNVLNVEKSQEVKPEKEDAAPVIENVKQEVEEENVPKTGNTLLHSNIFGALGVIISGLGTAIFKFRKK